MLTEVVIKRIHSGANSWVRVEQVGKIRGGLELSLGVHDGRRGKKLACWCVSCSGLYETQITDFDGGGLRLYTSDHPAAKQYVARRVELRWDRNCNQAAVLATLYQAHIDVVDDWIPFERYLFQIFRIRADSSSVLRRSRLPGGRISWFRHTAKRFD